MKKVAIVADTNSGFGQSDARDGFYLLPMPFIIDEEEYIEGKTLTKELFYKFMVDGSRISTVQPPVANIIDLYTEVLKEYDEILHIPMSSSLSDTYQTCVGVASHMGAENIYVADSKKISVPLKRNLQDAFKFVEDGLSAVEIKEIVEADNESMMAYVALDTLKYLNSGGRGSTALTTIGTLLRIKPVVFLGSGKVESAKNFRTMNQAREWMIHQAREVIENDENARDDYYLDVVHSNNLEEAILFKEKIINDLNWEGEVLIEELTLSIATHIGPGALGIAITKKLKK